MITRSQAWQEVNELIENQNLVKHCLAVEAAMRAYADHFQVPEAERQNWAVAGLIHDADWEKYPDQHPNMIIEWLKENGADPSVVNAVASHGFEFDVEPQTLMAKTLRAVDELTGLIVAVTLVRESKKLADVTVESVRKKWGTTGFAKGVKREDIERGAVEIGVELDDHIATVLKAMQETADELGL